MRKSAQGSSLPCPTSLPWKLPSERFAREQLKGQIAAVDARKAELAVSQSKQRSAKKALDNNLLSQDEYIGAEKGVEAVQSTLRIEEAKLRGLQATNPKTAELLATNDLAARRARLDRAQFGHNECFIKS